MFNRQIEITRENESLLFINAVIENLRYGIISLDMMFNGDEENLYQNYYDEHTFYFFHKSASECGCQALHLPSCYIALKKR